MQVTTEMKVSKKIAPGSFSVVDQPVHAFHKHRPERQKNHFLCTLCHILLKIPHTTQVCFLLKLRKGEGGTSCLRSGGMLVTPLVFTTNDSVAPEATTLIVDFSSTNKLEVVAKLVKRIAFIWEGGGLDRLRKAAE